MRRTARLAATLAAVIAPLAAAETDIVGPRALGMGGVGTACADDGSAAQYYNPAAFGFFGREGGDNNDLKRRRVWGFGVDVGAGLRVTGEMGDYISDLADSEDLIDRLGSTGIQNQQDVEELVVLANALANVDDPGNNFMAVANVGGTVRVGRFGVGVRMLAQAAGRVDDVDTVNVGIGNAGGGTMSQDIENAGGQQAGSIVLLQGLVGFTPQAAAMLEFQAQQAGITPQEAQQLVQLLNNANTNYGTGSSFDNNQTVVTFRGFAVAEVPITYGHAFSDQLAVGGSLKVMMGRVYGTSVLVFDEDADSFDTIDENYEESLNVGLDLGVMVRLPYVNLALSGRNLNRPSFDAPSGFEEVKVDPQVTLGASFHPWSRFTVAGDIQLLEEDTLVDGYSTQRAGLGVEWDIWRILALRAGVSKNLAESDIAMLWHAGVGVNLWVLRLDLAGAMSPDTVDFDGDEVPEEARVALRIASEW